MCDVVELQKAEEQRGTPPWRIGVSKSLLSSSAFYEIKSTSLNDIEILQRIGGGNFGTKGTHDTFFNATHSVALKNVSCVPFVPNSGDVFKGTWQGSVPVALKRVKLEDDTEDINREASILSRLAHPHIVQMYGMYEDVKGNKYMVTEFLNKGKDRKTVT